MIRSIHTDMAAKVLLRGGVIAYATESVWGFGCDPYNFQAVDRLLSVKQRSIDKGMLLVAANIDMVQPWLDRLPADVVDTMLASWPGPVTWVVPNFGLVPLSVTGGRDTVAIRVSAHRGVQALTSRFGGLIVSTSANLSGRRPCKTAIAVRKQFPSGLDYIYPGVVGGAVKPSSIFDAMTGQQLR